MKDNDLIFGKNPLQKIVGASTKNGTCYLYVADGNKTKLIKTDSPPYMLMDQYIESLRPGNLAGQGHYRFFKKFNSRAERSDTQRRLEAQGVDCFTIWDDVEAEFVRSGYTMFKSMEISDVSILSFDIETTGLKMDDNAFCLIIGNTFRNRDGQVTKKMFTYQDYETQGDMINAWCKWVREMNPDILTGHNIFGFDLPYLLHIANKEKTKLYLGRDASPAFVARRPRKFRKDGSQTYEYHNVEVFGRSVIDTFFLAIKYDIGRKYPSYGLKSIIEYEGLIKEGRQFWDFTQCKEPWRFADKWSEFKQYCEDDSDDSLALFDLMAPQFFYYTQSIPRGFQQIINTATGSQVNSFMLRAYLQQSMSIPEATPRENFEGAISFGNPGVYTNVYKIDVASLYPSIMMQYNVYDVKKDPQMAFLRAVTYFTEQRLQDKKMAAETGNRYYNDMANGRKIMINSFYGFLGTGGLHFNYPDGAALVTGHGRRILNQAIKWAEDKGFEIVNGDTDSISYVPNDGKTIEDHLEEINTLCPEKIRWESDGVFDSMIIVKAKNYAMKKGDKVKIKGSALKATMKEPALCEFLDRAINSLLNGEKDRLVRIYKDYVREILNVQDISRWASKKTVTDKVLNPKRTNEQIILDAIGKKHVQEGDKIHVFYDTKNTVCLVENFNGQYDVDRLLEKLFKTVSILSPVLDQGQFLNYKLKKNKDALEVIS